MLGYCSLCGHPKGGHTPAGRYCRACKGRCRPEPEYLNTIWEEGNKTEMASRIGQPLTATPKERALALWYAMGNIEGIRADHSWITEFMSQQRKVRSLLLGKQFQRKTHDQRMVEICEWFAELMGDALGDPEVTEKTKAFLAAQIAFSVRFSDADDGRYAPQPDDPDYVE